MTAETGLTEDLALARELAIGASEIALRFFDNDVAVQIKPDGTEVTPADFEVERFLVAQLSKRRPGDGILGEELGASGPAGRRWILDPIDGTSNFIAGKLQWGTHVALECDGEIVLGVISRPVQAHQWWATRGGGAFNGPAESSDAEAISIHVSNTTSFRESKIAVWAERPHVLIDLVEASASLAVADLDAILHLAEGRLDAVIDVTGKIWDHAPAVVLVEEAGGRFSDAENGHRIDRGEGRYTNGLIHDALNQALAG